MIASLLIIAVSLVLFVYWFRYTCLVILSGETNRDYAYKVANANHLTFLETQSLLSDSESEGSLSGRALGSLHTSLDRDYRLLSYLLTHAAAYQAGDDTFENRLLAIDYFVVNLWYRVICGVSDRLARTALLEMACIISHLANAMGQRVATSGKY